MKLWASGEHVLETFAVDFKPQLDNSICEGGWGVEEDSRSTYSA